MKVEIVSSENIGPSSTAAAPPHPRSYTLSRMDQSAVSAYTPIVIFYSPIENHQEDMISKRLKDSLSQVLTCFYPLAGRIHDARSVDCNDQGVEYAEARVNCNISSVLEKPSMEMLGQLIPNKVFATCSDPFVLVQANFFLCGGMALAVKVSHQVADGASVATFIKGWAKTALGSPDAVVPDLTVSARFPPAEGVQLISTAGNRLGEMSSEGVARRFAFGASKMLDLKEKMANDEVKVPTRVEAVSCFLWKRIVTVSKKAAAQGGSTRPSMTTALLGGVNARSSLIPPLPEYAFGNVVRPLCPMGDESEIESTGGLSLFRESVVESRRPQTGSASKSAAAAAMVMQKASEMKSYRYVSLCRSSFYEADFGWGKPTWVSFGDIGANSIALLDARDGGIQVWVRLAEEEMVLLEQDKELLEFASLNPQCHH